MDHTDLDQIERDQKIIADLGGPSKVAELLNFPKAGGQQRVQNWLARGIPPAIKVKRPDLFMKELPLPQQTHVREAINFVAKKSGEMVVDIPSVVQAITEVTPTVIRLEIEAAAPLTEDPVLEADLANAEQAGLVKLPKKGPVVKAEVNDIDPPVKLPPPASTEVADSLVLDERRKGPPTRRLRKQPFTGPDKRVGPPDRRGFKLPEVTAALPKGV